ncbi:hypothetical protein IFM89_038561 [Coptis chinensis]|uniref:Glycine-rich protein n=1 Tax=Coptis chinensis TaxID=261450 RepID=A0A835LNX9_9MAGN|nr:hypothetical protein IFM89_038561 [Coptis chinensis]
MVPAQSIYFGNNQRSGGSGEIFTGGKTISCYGGGGGGVYGSGTNFDGGATAGGYGGSGGGYNEPEDAGGGSDNFFSGGAISGVLWYRE